MAFTTALLLQTQLTSCQQSLARAELLLADLQLEKTSHIEQLEQTVAKLHDSEKNSLEAAARFQADLESADERHRSQEQSYRKYYCCVACCAKCGPFVHCTVCSLEERFEELQRQLRTNEEHTRQVGNCWFD